MKNIIFLAIATILLGFQANAANFYCSIGNQVYNSVPDDLGYGIAFQVDIQNESDDLSVYYTPGDTYFNVRGTFIGAPLDTSVAFNGEYPQQNFKFGSLTLYGRKLQCNLLN